MSISKISKSIISATVKYFVWSTAQVLWYPGINQDSEVAQKTVEQVYDALDSHTIMAESAKPLMCIGEQIPVVKSCIWVRECQDGVNIHLIYHIHILLRFMNQYVEETWQTTMQSIFNK